MDPQPKFAALDLQMGTFPTGSFLFHRFQSPLQYASKASLFVPIERNSNLHDAWLWAHARKREASGGHLCFVTSTPDAADPPRTILLHDRNISRTDPVAAHFLCQPDGDVELEYLQQIAQCDGNHWQPCQFVASAEEIPELGEFAHDPYLNLIVTALDMMIEDSNLDINFRFEVAMYEFLVAKPEEFLLDLFKDDEQYQRILLEALGRVTDYDEGYILDELRHLANVNLSAIQNNK